jgi:allophanate hydrolase subunit 2
MAYILDGPRLRHARGFNIISDGIAMGAIQVPGDGQPIVLMADRQVTGGYTKIATVIGADLGRLAQQRPGARLRFATVPLKDAVAARRAEHAALAAPLATQPVVRTTLSPELLLGVNLIDGVTSGD